jgi:hypothetical protein
MTPRIDQLAAPPVVGQSYLVPTVRYPWLSGAHVSDWPVMGPRHDDAEHLRFAHTHYHVDLRFLTRGQMDVVRQDREPRWAVASAPLVDEPRGSWGKHPDPIWRVLRCNRRDHRYPPLFEDGENRGHLFFALWRAYARRKCPRNADGLLVCPHKGFVLGSLKPDALGRVVCPLHGLRIDVANERVVTLDEFDSAYRRVWRF